MQVLASVRDANVGDTLSDNALNDTDLVADTFSVAPSGLSAGLYTLRLSDGSVSTEAELKLNVVANATLLDGMSAAALATPVVVRGRVKSMTSRGLNATAISSDGTRTAWPLYFGYDFTPNWGVEAAYVALGDASTRLTGTATDIDAFLAASRNIHPNTAQGGQFSGVYHYPLTLLPQLQAEARLGAFA